MPRYYVKLKTSPAFNVAESDIASFYKGKAILELPEVNRKTSNASASLIATVELIRTG
jgi:hypothetical protein